jgi:hypothetical protein
MQLSRQFVGFIGLILIFLLTAFATEDARCVARARRIFERMFSPIPAAIAEAEVRSEGEPYTFVVLGHPSVGFPAQAEIDAIEWASLVGESCLRPGESRG